MEESLEVVFDFREKQRETGVSACESVLIGSIRLQNVFHAKVPLQKPSQQKTEITGTCIHVTFR